MKIILPNCRWQGGTLDFVVDALKKLGHELEICIIDTEKEISPLTHYLKIRQVKKIQAYITKKVEDAYNKKILMVVDRFKPDLFFSLNCHSLYPETLKRIRQVHKVCTVSLVADNPFDSSRFKYFPYNLEHYEFLFLGDRIWEQNIRNLAPNSKCFHFVGAYDPNFFKPVNVDKNDLEKYGGNLAFAGTAYGEKAEGIYRSGILAQVADFGLKIWGDNAWDKTFKYYPVIKHAFQGRRLDFTELNKMYQITKINLNIPNPQCFTSFQQRTFEISAAKGFQIVDYREDIEKYFNEDEMVTFKNIKELREKINYFLKNPGKRDSFIEKAYKKVKNVHTYENRMKEILEKIGSN